MALALGGNHVGLSGEHIDLVLQGDLDAVLEGQRACPRRIGGKSTLPQPERSKPRCTRGKTVFS